MTLRAVPLFASLAACAAAWAGGTLHVSATVGSERSGSWWHPYASVGEALQVIRDAQARGEVGGWTVKVAAGNYLLMEPLVFTPADSGTPDAPVRIVGAGMEKTRLLGAKRLTGFTKGADGRWTAPIPTGEDGAPLWFETLFVNGVRATRARHPNTGYFNPEAVREQVVTNRAPRGVYSRALLVARPADVLPGISADALRYAQLVVHHNWDSTRRILAGYDAATRTYATQGEAWKHWNKWRTNSLYYVENVPAALDAPGEWLYDGAHGRIVYIPRAGEDPATAEVLFPVPGLKQVVVFAGGTDGKNPVHDIVLEGIAFSYTDSPRRAAFLKGTCLPTAVTGDLARPGPTQCPPMQAAAWTEAAVMLDGAVRVTFRDCAISHTGEYALWCRNACTDDRFERCLMTDLGAGGVRIGGNVRRGRAREHECVTTVLPGETGRITVDNCIITHGGRRHAPGVGVWIAGSPFNTVTHCEISDFLYTGVSIGWVWGYAGSVAQGNTLAFCHIHDIGQRALGDMGGVYTLGTSFGTCVSNNVIHHVDSYTYGGWGLYPDEGSEGIVMENNLVYDTKDASFHQHYGRNNVLRNNILAYSREGQVAVTRAEPHRSVTVAHNILFWDRGHTFNRYAGTARETAKIDWIGNLWWKTDEPIEFNGKTFAEWQAKGNDVTGCVADPLFVDPARRDFRLKPESPALKAGFRPFDPSEAGVYGSAAWRARAAE